MREIYQALDGMPCPPRSNVWHVEKIRHEEAGELLEVTWDNPNPEQLALMLKEGSDIIINVLQIARNCGVTYEEMERAIIDKIDEISQRPPESFERGIRIDGVVFNGEV